MSLCHFNIYSNYSRDCKTIIDNKQIVIKIKFDRKHKKTNSFTKQQRSEHHILKKKDEERKVVRYPFHVNSSFDAGSN